MGMYKFVPNQMAREAFNLAAPEYVGHGMIAMLKKTLGEQNFEKHMIAQDPLGDDRVSGEIRIILNPDEPNPALKRFESIGTIFKLD